MATLAPRRPAAGPSDLLERSQSEIICCGCELVPLPGELTVCMAVRWPHMRLRAGVGIVSRRPPYHYALSRRYGQ